MPCFYRFSISTGKYYVKTGINFCDLSFLKFFYLSKGLNFSKSLDKLRNNWWVKFLQINITSPLNIWNLPVKSVDNLCICWNISHPAYVVAVIMLIIFSVFWIFYMGIKFCNLEFSQGFIFAGLNFKNFFYNRKKQEIKDLQN